MGGHEHVQLRGTFGSTSRTKLAEPYPYPLCATLAAACCRKAGWLAKGSRLDVAACARQSHLCVGEARHPGPLVDLHKMSSMTPAVSGESNLRRV